MIKEIYLAGGCFWGVEAYFKSIDGIVDTKVGYANGKTDATTYEKVNETDHAETVYLKYDDRIAIIIEDIKFAKYLLPKLFNMNL